MSKSPSEVFAVRCNAYHEAGHAVAAVKHGFRISSLDIRPVNVPGLGATFGSAEIGFPSLDALRGKGADAVMPILVVMFAGVFGEQRINAEAGLNFGHPQSDGQRAFRFAAGAICKPASRDDTRETLNTELQRNGAVIDACLEKARQRAQDFVADYGAAIDAVAESLAQSMELMPEEVDRIIADAMNAQAGQ